MKSKLMTSPWAFMDGITTSRRRRRPIFLIMVIIMGSLLHGLKETDAHGTLFDPPNRSSLWRFPEFAQTLPTDDNNIDYNDVEHYCGGVGVQYEQNGGKCGVCGDPWNQPKPRDNEDGGKYASGIIVRNYTAGQVVPLKIYMDKAHWGYFEIRLCQRDNVDKSTLSQECLDKNLLKFASPGLDTKYFVDNANSLFYINTGVHLPKNLRCKKCVLQWHYRAANTWGDCGNGTQANGCGNQEIFRACSDIRIH